MILYLVLYVKGAHQVSGIVQNNVGLNPSVWDGNPCARVIGGLEGFSSMQGHGNAGGDSWERVVDTWVCPE